MGRGDWCKPKAPPPKPVAQQDYLKDLINHYQKERNISAEALGAKIGKSGAAVRSQKARGTNTWTTEDLLLWCAVLNIPGKEIGDAFARGMEARK